MTASLRVGITADWKEYEGAWVSVLDRRFVEWLAAGGLQPVILPALPGREEEALNGVHALVLSGGGDLRPEFYSGSTAPHPEERYSHRDRCAFELALSWRAFHTGMPLLGICLGCQTLNVAFGGDLIRHLADPQFRHRRQGPGKPNPLHRLRIVPETLFASLGPTRDNRVLSSHHQAVGRLAPGWVASAFGPDEVVEAIEEPSNPRALGIQWHPERTPHSPLSAQIAAWLRAEAEGYRAGR